MTAVARRVLVFARAPIPGQCKTRLIPALGSQGAARLHRALTRRTLALAVQADAEVELWCAPDVRHAFFVECRLRFGAALRRQPHGDLGARMAAGLRSGARATLIVGTDCADLTVGDLVAGFEALRTHDYVLQPAGDGGFVSIGASAPDSAVLRHVDWSSGKELAQTQQRLARAGRSVALLPQRWDIDTAADLRRAQREGVLPGPHAW